MSQDTPDDADKAMPWTLETFYDEDGQRRPDAEILAWCMREHTAARGADVYGVVICDYSAAEWAEMTGRDRSTVARNVRRAKRAD